MKEKLSYAKVGVDIAVMDGAKKEMAKSVDSGDPRVLNRMGAFASLLEGRFDTLRHPILVFKTEEPGSKQKLAYAQGRFKSIAYDLVNHLVNDVIVMGAEPLYVQDCIVCGTIAPATVTALVSNMAAACKEQGCVLVGGETSVQPGVVADGEYVLSASAIGVVDRDRIIDGSTISEGDVVLGVASNGLHTNGYTLVRRLLERNNDLHDMEVNGASFMDAILLPHTCYYKAIRGLFGHSGLKGLAHITGGGIEGNLNRILPGKVDVLVDLPSLRVLEVFQVIREEGDIPDAEMLRTFNMGVGLTIVCSQDAVAEIVAHLAGHNCTAYPIGTIMPGKGRVRYRRRLKW